MLNLGRKECVIVLSGEEIGGWEMGTGSGEDTRTIGFNRRRLK